MKKYPSFLLITFLAVLIQPACALTFDLPSAEDNVVGQIQVLTADANSTLSDLGMQYDAGRDAMIALNPQFDPDDNLPGIVPIVIPTRYILPDYPHRGIVVNLSEMRLYYYPPGTHKVMTYPIGIGRAGYMTPLGLTYVTRKVRDPIWTPPQSIRDFNKKRGVILPKVIQGGPDNPLGRRAIYLGIPQYLIHATNFPQSIGSRGSFGCMRMMESDIEQLFPLITPKTPVMIIEEPYKAGWLNGQLYLEIHRPLDENKYYFQRNIKPVLATLLQLSIEHHVVINWFKVNMAIQNQLGIPTPVSEPANTSAPHFMTEPLKWPKGTHLCSMSGLCTN